MSEDYHSSARVDEVIGPMGPLYFAKVTIEGTPVDGMVDPGLFATNMCFDLFKKAYSQQCPEVPHVTLRDYSQNHSYWGPSEPHIQVGRNVSRCSPSLSWLPPLCCLPRIGS